jgi:LysM repeat protein
MKILKILGIVAGLHAFALLLIFANPGCSSTSKPAPAAADTAPKPADSAVIVVPPTASAPSIVAVGPAPASGSATISYAADTAAVSTPRFSPTRPGTAVATALEAPPVADVTPAMTYAVAHGDSLSTIARRHHLTIAELAAANNLKPGSVLHVGQKLVIPGKRAAAVPAARAADASASATTAAVAAAPASGPSSDASAAQAPAAGALRHTVKAGETLGSIARHYGVRVGDLGAVNSISDPKKIRPGQELIIPTKSDQKAGAAQGGAHGRAAKTAKAPADGAASAAAGNSTLIAVPSSAPAPAPGQDLDAGLKPSAATEVPVIKIDEGTAALPPKNP